jgi:UDP-N-acetyl-D-mannosaminuronic acid transferase (WecB/TagA/CpsF family)
MNQKLWTIGIGGVLLAGGIGLAMVAMVMAEPTKGPVFIAGDKPVTEDQVRQKLQSEGWSNIQIGRDDRFFEATGSKDGQASKMEVDSQTGRLRASDDDDDDDDE